MRARQKARARSRLAMVLISDIINARLPVTGVLLTGILFSGAFANVLQGAPANPFDPSGFVQKEAVVADKLVSQGMYRINGERFFQYRSTQGAVLLPAIGDRPEVHVEFALCPQHLSLQKEVLVLRQNLPLEAKTKQLEPTLIALIAACRHGQVEGPTVRERQPDGAVVERRAVTPPD